MGAFSFSCAKVEEVYGTAIALECFIDKVREWAREGGVRMRASRDS
jgi:hypothetical protein